MTPRAKAKPAATAGARTASTRRPAWQGSISFGLIHFPVALYGVTTDRRIAFHQLHDADGVRIKQKRVCPADGEEVPYEHIVRGYEFEPGRYVIVERDELDALQPERSRSIELEKFIDASEIDPLYYDASYFALPGEGAGAAYALLCEAMTAEDRAAFARLVMHGKEHLVALWPRDAVLVVSTMHFEDEITNPAQLPAIEPAGSLKKKNRKPAELNAARQLVSALSGDFDIADYRDEHREAVLELIEAKAKGRKISVPATPQAERRPAADLMSALEESLAGVTGGAGKPARPKSRRRGNRGDHRAHTKAH